MSILTPTTQGDVDWRGVQRCTEQAVPAAARSNDANCDGAEIAEHQRAAGREPKPAAAEHLWHGQTVTNGEIPDEQEIEQRMHQRRQQQAAEEQVKTNAAWFRG